MTVLHCRSTFNYSLPRPHQASFSIHRLHLQLYAKKNPVDFNTKSTNKSRAAVPSSSNSTKPTKLVTSAEITSSRSNEETVAVLQPESVVNESHEFRGVATRDNHGLGAKLNSMSKWAAAGAFGAVILWRRDGEATWVACGAVINFFLSVTLKSIVKQARPPSCTCRSDPGMPSSHAQTLFYVVTCAILATVKWVGRNEVSMILSTLFLASGSYLTWQRVLRKFHTAEQVAVGAVVGTSFGGLWYYGLWNGIMGQAFISSVWARAVVHLGALYTVHASFCISLTTCVMERNEYLCIGNLF